MKLRIPFIKLTAILSTLLISVSLAKTQIACVGDSITFGAGIQNREQNSYPAQLQKQLGDAYQVHNFGLPGATMLKKGNFSYWNAPHYKRSLELDPQIVIIKLGTNDGKPMNWKHKAEYIADYTQMVKSYQALQSKPTIYLCKPVPSFFKDTIVPNKHILEMLPMVDTVAKSTGVSVIDLYKPLDGKAQHFPDKLHPNAAGATIMMQTIARAIAPSQKTVSLFDGKSLDQWNVDPKIWRIQDECITAGSHDSKPPYNSYISTKKSYANFELNLQIKCSGDPQSGLINSGIQIRSKIHPNGGMAGYQIDCGRGWFGKIYDEHRRGILYPKPLNEAEFRKKLKFYDWNHYRILTEGPRIQAWINGVHVIDYTEANPTIPLNGHIAAQIHCGGKVMVQVKEITIKELPATPNAPTWESLGGVLPALKKFKTSHKN